VDPSISYVFSTLGVAIVGMIFVVRRTLVLRSAESLASHPDDALALGHWKSGYLATYALSEALALFGLILRFMGCNFRAEPAVLHWRVCAALLLWPEETGCCLKHPSEISWP
jgi:hypothetical protein